MTNEDFSKEYKSLDTSSTYKTKRECGFKKPNSFKIDTSLNLELGSNNSDSGVNTYPSSSYSVICITKDGSINYENTNVNMPDTKTNKNVDYLIERDGTIKEITGPHPFPAIVGSVALQSAAFEAGLKSGDLILAANANDIFNFTQLQKIVKETSAYPINLEVWRDGQVYNILVTPRIIDYPIKGGGFVKRKLIGITSGTFFEIQRVKINLFEASKFSVQQILSIVLSSLDGIKNILIGSISTCNLQGPIGIASTAGDAAQQGIGTFLRIIAVLSTAIGMLNLFPIPMLDGGHLVFYGFEAVTKKPPSEKIMKTMTLIGIFILLSLMIIAISSDLFCP